MRVSDYIADFIYKLGVEDVFMLTGAGIMHLTDGVACHEKLRAVCVHHEQSAAMAVDGYARANENIGVAYFTTGPGVTNALTGVVGAWQDSVPCLFISGQVKKKETSFNSGIRQLRQFGVQELNVLPIVESVCKYSTMLNDPQDIRCELEKADYIAKSGRPGPVWIDIPMDVQSAKIDPKLLKGFKSTDKKLEISKNSIKKVAGLLKISKRPVVIAGRGVRLAKGLEALSKFVKKFNIPVVTPYLGIDNICHRRKEYIGKTGVKGDRPANLAMQNADLIISIGSSLHVTVIGYEYNHFAREAKKIVVDIDETSHRKKTIDIDHFIQGDAKEFLNQLHIVCDQNKLPDFSRWLDQCSQLKKQYPVCLPEYADTKDAINIYSFVDQLSLQSAEGDVFVADTGSALYAISQGVKLFKPNQRYIPSGAMATMGFSLPAAIGISIALGRKRVLAITGDGSLQQNIQELQTVVQYNLPIKLFVLNNDGYLSIRNSQKTYFDQRFIGESEESGVSFPDTLKIADAYGINSYRVSNLNALEKVIAKALNFQGPVICDIIIPREQLIIPTVSSRVNEDGSMSSRPLEDMFPFLDREEYRKNLFIKEV